MDMSDDPYAAMFEEGGTMNGKPFRSIFDLLNSRSADRKVDTSSAKRLTKKERKLKKWKRKKSKR